MADGVVEGYYFARFQGYSWWNLIVCVSGKEPFLEVDWIVNLADDEWTNSPRKIRAMKEEMVFGPKMEMPPFQKVQPNTPKNPNRDEVPGWIRAVDDMMVVTHLGIADPDDSYETARDKLQQLIRWHVDVATDPATNGGYVLTKRRFNVADIQQL